MRSAAGAMGPSARLVLGTRGSGLALWQARHVASALRSHDPRLALEERIVRTEGDVDASPAFSGWSVGVFVRRLEQALRAGTIDLAVHSLKDVPTEMPSDLRLSAVLVRHDARDALVTRSGAGLSELEPGTLVGTGSLRRRAQLLRARPDLRTRPVRGNVDTRVRKLVDGDYGALVLAVAGIERLGVVTAPWVALAKEVCLPAVGQGAIVVETRADDERTIEIVRGLDHGPTRAAIEAERAFLDRLGGGCLAPSAAHAELEDGALRLRAFAADADGVDAIHDEERGPTSEAITLGLRLAERMLGSGAGELLARARASGQQAGTDGA
jgi:hydroxymethylbilane synthase